MSIFQAAVTGQVTPKEEEPKKTSIFKTAAEENARLGVKDIRDLNERTRPRTALEHVQDPVDQFNKNLVSGIIGGVGSLAEATGFQQPQERDPFGQRELRQSQEFETLSRFQEPGYTPTAADIYSLQSEDAIPEFRLPTMRQVNKGIEGTLGIGEPKTVQGRFAQRAGSIVGQGVGFGAGTGSLRGGVSAGVAGQTVEELGGGPLAQTAAEIVSLGKAGSRGSDPLRYAEQQINDRVLRMRQLGYTDNEIVLAIKAAEHQAQRNPKSFNNTRKGASSEATIEGSLNRSEELVDEILQGQVPGLERGPQYLHDAASNWYGQVAQAGANIPITNSGPFVQRANAVIADLRNTLGANPEVQPLIERLESAIAAAGNNPSAQTLVNFYQELNGMGKWVSRSKKDHYLRQMKEGVMDTLNANGPQGQQFAQLFETANWGVQRAYQAQEMVEMMNVARTADGINFGRLRKTFDNPENVRLYEQVLGTQATENLRQVARTGSEIRNFDKAWKAATAKPGLISTGSAMYLFLHGDYLKAAAVLTSGPARKAMQFLREQSLTNPRFQNIMIRFNNALRNQSPQAFATVQKDFEQFARENGIDPEELISDENPSKSRK